jgi:predicted RNA methylase
MDVGAGTGILSIFAIKAGAKKVIAIEQAEIFSVMETIVKDNKYNDKIIMIKNDI